MRQSKQDKPRTCDNCGVTIIANAKVIKEHWEHCITKGKVG